VLRRFSSEYQVAPPSEESLESSFAREVADLKEATEALQRWEGEGGSPTDLFGVVEDLNRRAVAATPNLRARASWPGWTSGLNGRLTPPPRVPSAPPEVADLTDPRCRGYGFYLVKVPSAQYSQIIRASHATASRLARSRTQYGSPSELYFLEEIETPALD
jgi:hypothetical protein